MANSNDEVEGSWSPRRPRTRTAAEQRASSAPASKDAATLAADIEKTREELAETLDAIADRVSPKKVAARTSQRVGDSVKQSAARAGESVRAGAASVKDSAAVAAVKDATSSTVGKHAVGEPAPVTGIQVDPAPSTGAPAGPAAPVSVGPSGAEVPPYLLPQPAAASRLPLYGAAALVVLLLVRRWWRH